MLIEPQKPGTLIRTDAGFVFFREEGDRPWRVTVPDEDWESRDVYVRWDEISMGSFEIIDWDDV